MGEFHMFQKRAKLSNTFIIPFIDRVIKITIINVNIFHDKVNKYGSKHATITASLRKKLHTC